MPAFPGRLCSQHVPTDTHDQAECLPVSSKFRPGFPVQRTVADSFFPIPQQMQLKNTESTSHPAPAGAHPWSSLSPESRQSWQTRQPGHSRQGCSPAPSHWGIDTLLPTPLLVLSSVHARCCVFPSWLQSWYPASGDRAGLGVPFSLMLGPEARGHWAWEERESELY